MKKVICVLLLIVLAVAACACADPDAYVLTDKTYFRILTHMRNYPEGYLGKDITFDSFTYRLTDVEGVEYMCAVRKCSAGYGCNCGKDSIIGFILDYDGEIPEPRNQSEDSVEKTWIRTTGQLTSAEKTWIEIFAYTAEGEIDYAAKPEKVDFYILKVKELSLIEDYSELAYYVTK